MSTKQTGKHSNSAVVIAAYNEQRHIKELILAVQEQGYQNIIVVDDGSKDKTVQEAKETGVTVLRHLINCGKGAAVRTGCDYAVEHGAARLILMDGDGQHDPTEITKIESLLEENDIVFGMREEQDNMPLFYRIGNWGLNTISRMLFGIAIRDTQCGYRAMTKEAYEKVRWESNDYSMESEMIVRAGIRHLRHEEVTINTIYHEKYKGTGIYDGVLIVLRMLRWRLFLR